VRVKNFEDQRTVAGISGYEVLVGALRYGVHATKSGNAFDSWTIEERNELFRDNTAHKRCVSVGYASGLQAESTADCSRAAMSVEHLLIVTSCMT